MPASFMFPHTVTLYNATENPDSLMVEANITILEGVFLDAAKGSNVIRSGLESADAATLFIPMSIEAVNGVTGQKQAFLPSKEYDRLDDKSGNWTLRSGGASSAVECFFVKGVVVEQASFQSINQRYDDVYRVTSVDTLDYGSPDLQHWEVGGV